jgi:hypothetical protein
MINLILHITIPAGLRLQSPSNVVSTLAEPVTFDLLSACTPFYASVDQVRLSGGPLLRSLQDITIASQIYNNSKEADLLHVRKVSAYGPSDRLTRYQGAQNQWVQSKAARELLLNISTQLGGPGSHVLANFSVTKQKGFETEGLPELLKDLKDQIKEYEVVLRSGGRVAPGGHVAPAMAAKGVMDFMERTPGRNWVVTGMGANTSTSSYASGDGGRGKTVKFYGSPMFSGMMSGYRLGIWQSGSPLHAISPFAFPLSAGAF